MESLGYKISFVKEPKKGFLSVLIPVYNDVEGLRLTLKHLKSQSLKKENYEVLVGNDGENENIKRVCQQLDVICINIKTSLGSYDTRNRLIEKSQGEFIAFIDAGVIPNKLWLDNGRKLLLNDDYIGGPIEVINQNKTISKFLLKYQEVSLFAVNQYMSNLHFAPTANLFVKRKVIDILGGFDERLISSGDYEFGDRIFRSKVFTQKFSSDLLVFHDARTFKELINKQKRLSLGFVKLNVFHAKRFYKFSNSLLINFIKIFLPPVWLFKRYKFKKLNFINKLFIFLISYFFSALGNYYKVIFTLIKPRVLTQVY